MHLDDLTPEQIRRFQLWRSLTELSNAHAAGHLTADRVTLLEALAGNLQTLAARLSKLANRSRELVRLAEQAKRPPADA